MSIEQALKRPSNYHHHYLEHADVVKVSPLGRLAAAHGREHVFELELFMGS